MLEWCCKRGKLVGGLLLKRSKMCGSDAVQGTNWLWECCCKESKMCGTADVERANLM